MGGEWGGASTRAAAEGIRPPAPALASQDEGGALAGADLRLAWLRRWPRDPIPLLRHLRSAAAARSMRVHSFRLEPELLPKGGGGMALLLGLRCVPGAELDDVQGAVLCMLEEL